MALDIMPINGFVQSVDAGEEATVEPVKADLNFLHGKFDSVTGHKHTGAAGDSQKIGIDGLKQEVLDMSNVKAFHLHLVGTTAAIATTRVYSGLVDGQIINWQTPTSWNGLNVLNCELCWHMSCPTSGHTNYFHFEISFDNATWHTVQTINTAGTNDATTTGVISENIFPFYYRMRFEESGFLAPKEFTLHLLDCYMKGSFV